MSARRRRATTPSQQACWEGLQQGVFSLFSSDHCPFRYDDPQGKLAPKGRTSFRWVPNGIPGVETRLPILFSEGVGKGRITLNEFVALTATNHAKTYGLYPKKGTIAVGSDADIAIWDPNARGHDLAEPDARTARDYTPYEGIEVTGWPVSTMVRGKFVVRDGKLVGARRRRRLRAAREIAAGDAAQRDLAPTRIAGVTQVALPESCPRQRSSLRLMKPSMRVVGRRIGGTSTASVASPIGSIQMPTTGRNHRQPPTVRPTPAGTRTHLLEPRGIAAAHCAQPGSWALSRSSSRSRSGLLMPC